MRLDLPAGRIFPVPSCTLRLDPAPHALESAAGAEIDANWLAEKRARSHPITPVYWFAMAIPFVCLWLLTSTTGAIIGAALGDPKRYGADFAFTALFIALVAAFWKGRVTAWTVASAGIASALAYRFAGPPWHVLAGALSGLAAAWIAAGSEATAQPVESPAE